MRLKGKTALVAGAGRNVGRTIALTFAREGADLILVARKLGDELKQVAKECESIGVQVLPMLADVGNYEEVNHVVQSGLERFGKVDVLMNVVGIRRNKLPWEFSYEEWHHIFAVNAHSTFYLVKALAPGMIERKSGSIIAMGGHSALTCSTPYTAALAASKHALYGLIKGLAQAFGPYGVRANLLSLANIETKVLDPESYIVRGPRGEIIHTGTQLDPSTTEEENKRRSPLGRLGTQQEVANAALFLASDESSYITGDRMVCAGGVYM
ncbi:MAG: SDR family oxidoreductase [Betaproteobacteria bacterium]|nr:SDR family oxidoreductase [Betaproteobacteria bacterium]